MPYEIPAPCSQVGTVGPRSRENAGRPELRAQMGRLSRAGVLGWRERRDRQPRREAADPVLSELVEAFARLLPEPCLIDGEVVVPKGEPGEQRLDWESLSQRIHPAASRVNMVAEKTPAMFIAFDLLARGDRDLQPEPFEVRRAELLDLLGGVPHPVHVTRTTDDPALAERWLSEFEGAGLDGVIAKPLAQPYAPNKRTMSRSSTPAPPTSSRSATASTSPARASVRSSSGCTPRTGSSTPSAASRRGATSAGSS